MGYPPWPKQSQHKKTNPPNPCKSDPGGPGRRQSPRENSIIWCLVGGSPLGNSQFFKREVYISLVTDRGTNHYSWVALRVHPLLS